MRPKTHLVIDKGRPEGKIILFFGINRPVIEFAHLFDGNSEIPAVDYIMDLLTPDIDLGLLLFQALKIFLARFDSHTGSPFSA
jgi:hypothetical protein